MKERTNSQIRTENHSLKILRNTAAGFTDAVYYYPPLRRVLICGSTFFLTAGLDLNDKGSQSAYAFFAMSFMFATPIIRRLYHLTQNR